MSYQSKIAQALAKVKRKNFDRMIKLVGRPISVLRFRITTDMYDDETRTLIDKQRLEVNMVFPSEIPLYRFDRNNYNKDVDDTGVFMFDILPIEIFTKWGDKVEKGDFIVCKLRDEVGNGIELLLQITETVGQFDTYSLIWKKSLCAPYSGQLEAEIQTLINTELSTL